MTNLFRFDESTLALSVEDFLSVESFVEEVDFLSPPLSFTFLLFAFFSSVLGCSDLVVLPVEFANC